jgi:hypothetical protein
LRFASRSTAAVVLVGLLVTTAFAQSAGYRTRDRQARTRNADRNRSTRSLNLFPARNLPVEFAVLQTRSIFSRDRMAARVIDPSLQGDGRAADNRANPQVFRGVLEEGAIRLAGIERGTSSLTWYREGQTLRDGAQITQISLDQLTITHPNGDRRVITIGDSLDAGTAVSRAQTLHPPTTQPGSDRLSPREEDAVLE